MVTSSLGAFLEWETDYQIQTFHSPLEALASHRDRPVDIVIADFLMPEMNGLVATQTIRELEREAGTDVRVPIVGLTAHALKGDREMCINAGMDDYVPKPISVNKLCETIGNHLGDVDVASSAS